MSNTGQYNVKTTQKRFGFSFFKKGQQNKLFFINAYLNVGYIWVSAISKDKETFFKKVDISKNVTLYFRKVLLYQETYLYYYSVVIFPIAL